jgi:cell division transport system permease protein
MIRIIFKNTLYYLSEFSKIFKQSVFSNIFSIVSTSLIFLLLSITISGWWISSKLVDSMKDEAEINIFFVDGLDQNAVNNLIIDIKNIAGVLKISSIDSDEAYTRMSELLGNETEILELFDENPFLPFLEINIDIDKFESVLLSLEDVNGIDYIRNNKEMLGNLQKILSIIKFLGIFMLAAIGVSTVIIISHMIRLGINNNSEQVKTLMLLGAPKGFIILPYFLNALAITLSGSVISIISIAIVKQNIYLTIIDVLPFLPITFNINLLDTLALLLLGIGVSLAIIGTIFGIVGIEKDL